MNQDQTIPDWKHDPEQKNKLIAKMVELLRQGHTMLDEVCPRCGAILFFRKDVGLKYCPNCDVFIATPEEIQKAKTKNIKIIGEIGTDSGKKSSIETKQPTSTKTHEYSELRVKRISQKELGGNISAGQVGILNNIIEKIIMQIDRIIDHEINRLSLTELVKILESLVRITRILGRSE